MRRLALLLVLAAVPAAAPVSAQVPGVCTPDAGAQACVTPNATCADAGAPGIFASASALGACDTTSAPAYSACRASGVRLEGGQVGQFNIEAAPANRVETPCTGVRLEQWPRLALGGPGLSALASGLSSSTDVTRDSEWVRLADGSWHESLAAVKASVGHIRIAGPGFSVVARGVSAIAGDTPEGIRWSVAITRLIVNGAPVEAVEGSSTQIAPGVVLHVSEPALTPGGRPARNALRVATPLGDVIVAQAMLQH